MHVVTRLSEYATGIFRIVPWSGEEALARSLTRNRPANALHAPASRPPKKCLRENETFIGVTSKKSALRNLRSQQFTHLLHGNRQLPLFEQHPQVLLGLGISRVECQHIAKRL